MSGDNCAVLGCGTSRRTKGVGIFKLSTPKNEEYKTWRAQWLSELTKTRVIDKDFLSQIDNDRVYTCEIHFKEEDIEAFAAKKMTEKKTVFGALPVLNMPSRSHERENVQPRQSLERVQAPAALQTYQSFAEVCRKVPQLKVVKENWEITLLNDRVILRKTKVPYLLPEYQIVIDDSLGFTLSVFHWLLPENHELYKTHYRSVKHLTFRCVNRQDIVK